MRIDLHTHSSVSDGTEAPAQVVASAGRAGLDVVALTDHDTTLGWDEAAAAAIEHGIALVRGAELSCRSRGRSLHLLSYLHDPAAPALLAEGERTRAARDARAREMVDRLSRDLVLTWADVEAQTSPGTTVGRPHLADALVARGHVADREEAFATLLGAGSPYYVHHHAPTLEDSIALVRAAGGVPVLAHPAGREARVSDADVAAWAELGLAGLEVDHRDHDDGDRARLAALAARLGLLATGSSDYHGAGKPNRLGEFTTAPEVLSEIERQGSVAVVRP